MLLFQNSLKIIIDPPRDSHLYQPYQKKLLLALKAFSYGHYWENPSCALGCGPASSAVYRRSSEAIACLWKHHDNGSQWLSLL
jgi:hypothetical protein